MTRTACQILLVAFLALPVAHAQAAGLTAVVVQAEGSVTAADPEDLGPGAEIRPLQILAAGSVVTVPSDARVGLLCSTERLVLLSGPARWSLTAPGCAEGRALPLGSHDELAPQGGRLRSLAGALVLELGIRGDGIDDPQVPLLLTPRGANVRDERPVLRWRQALGAEHYLLEITGLARRVRIDAEAVGCATDPAWDDEVVCSLAFPQDHPGLAPGESYAISVAAERAGAAGEVREKPAPWVRRLESREAQSLAEQLDAATSLPLGPPALDLAIAAIYARHQLYDEVLATLRRSQAASPLAEVDVALGDLYTVVGLLPWAERAYRRVVADDARPAARAAALFGLGRVFFHHWRFTEALEALRRAGSLFAEVDCGADAKAAADAAAEAESRLPLDRRAVAQSSQGWRSSPFMRVSFPLTGPPQAPLDSSRADAILVEAGHLVRAGRAAEAAPAIDAALALLAEAGDRPGEASALLLRGLIRSRSADPTNCVVDLEAALAMFRELHDPTGSWLALWTLGEWHRQEGKPDAALDRLRQAEAILLAAEAPPDPLRFDTIGRLAAFFGAPSEILRELGPVAALVKPFWLAFLRAATLDSQGRTFLDLDRLAQAERALLEAAGLSRSLGGLLDVSIEAHLGDLRRRQWRLEEAAQHYRAAVAGLERLAEVPFVGAPTIALDALGELAEIELLAGKFDEALRWNDRALERARREADPALVVSVLSRRARLFALAGRVRDAEPILDEALRVAGGAGGPLLQAEVAADLGGMLFVAGSLERAASVYERALELLHGANRPDLEAGVSVALAAVYESLDAPGDGQALLERGRQLASEHEFLEAEGLADLVAAWSDAKAGTITQAEMQERWEEILARLASGTVEAKGLARFLGLGLGGAAKPAGTLAPEQFARIPAEALPFVTVLKLARQGLANFREGRLERARADWQSALPEATALANPILSATLMGGIGAVFWQEGRAAQAAEWLQRANRTVDEAATGIFVDDLLAGFLGGEWRLYYSLLVEALAAQGRWGEAFAEAERARARALLAVLGGQRLRPTGSVDRELITQANGLRAALAAWEQECMGAVGPDRLRLESDLARGRSEYARLLTRIKVTSPEIAALSRVEPVDTAAIQASLAPGTLLLSYFITPRGTMAWAVDEDSIRGLRLEFGEQEDRQVRCLASSFGAPPDTGTGRGVRLLEGCDDTGKALESLYTRLIAPFAADLGDRRLVVVPHGVLHYLPFAALRDPETGRYLIEERSIAFAPSGSVLPHLQASESPITGKALVLGSSLATDPNLPALVHAEDEARRVAELLGTEPLLGGRAAEAAIFARAGSIDLLHVAAHGVFDPKSPRFSRLHLAPGDGRDGNLETHEAFGELDLSEANLVVLSACETSVGERSGGDEIVSLTRAFLYAGAGGVVSTLWRIDDAAAARLMEEFYRRLLAGDLAAEALRRAQIETLRDSKFRDPFFWAAYTLTGDPQKSWGRPIAAPIPGP